MPPYPPLPGEVFGDTSLALMSKIPWQLELFRGLKVCPASVEALKREIAVLDIQRFEHRLVAENFVTESREV